MVENFSSENACYIVSHFADYEGFESDEAVEGSSSEDDDDISEEEEDEEEGGVEETSEEWMEEKDGLISEAGVRSATGVEEPGSDR